MLYWLFEISQGTDLEKFLISSLPDVRAGFACIAAFLIVMLLGEKVIRRLISMKIGQPIRTARKCISCTSFTARKLAPLRWVESS